MRRGISLIVVALVFSLAGCKSSGSGKKTGASSGSPCSGGVVDLSKISGDWIAADPLEDYDGKIPGDQYRLRFTPPTADGTVKALLAWRMDTRPFTGKLEKNALGYRIKLVEDMTDDVIAQLRAQNNQDPRVRMRAALTVTAAESGCGLEVLDNFQSFLGEKTVENTALGLVKMTAYTGKTPMSFVRCTAAKTIYFDGKAEDEQGRPRVNVVADKPVKIRSVADPSQLPEGCTFFGDVYVDGALVKEKVPGVATKEGEADALAFETEVTVPQGATHPVELHIWGECGDSKERKLVASLCNFAATR